MAGLLMNEYTNKAGSVKHEHILSHGFEVFETINGNDMGQMEYELPQFRRESDGLEILGGYWHYKIKDKEGNTLIEDIWWNSNKEFDTTMREIENEVTENKVDWFGYDKTKFTNAKELKDYKVGDEVLVFDMSNYKQPFKKMPFDATIVEISAPSILVKVDDEILEIYDYQIGERKSIKTYYVDGDTQVVLMKNVKNDCDSIEPGENNWVKEDDAIKLRESSDLYNELLYAVQTKYPNGTRHETALRYIKNCEVDNNETDEAI